MSLNYPVDHGQPQTRSALTFRRKKWLHAPPARFLVHTDARIFHLHVHPRRRGTVRRERDGSYEIRLPYAEVSVIHHVSLS